MDNKLCGLVGERLSHSYSAVIHEMLGNSEYRLFELAPEELDAFFARDDIYAVNVTIPYKRTVLRYCSKLSDEAEEIGAVNTMLRSEDGSFVGYNTDLYGFEYMLRRADISLEGRKLLILGSGGASRTVQIAAKRGSASEIVVISRTGENNYSNLELHADAEIIINTTPVGMYPDTEGKPISLEKFPDCRAVVDLIYNPTMTPLLKEAKRKGLNYTNGLSMLAAQAKAAEELFFGEILPDALTESVLKRLEEEQE